MSKLRSSLEGRRLAVVLRDLRVGGAERQATLLVEALARLKDCHVEVWCLSGTEGPNRRRLEEVGVPILLMSPGGSGSVLIRPFELFRFLIAARARKIDLLIPFTDWPNKVCGALWPLIGTRGSIWNQRDEGREITGRLLERLALRLSSVFACNSPSGEKFLHEEMGVSDERLLRVRNWIRMDAPQKTPHQWRKKLGVPRDRALVLMVANIHPFKDHPTLLRAWKLVSDQFGEEGPLLLLAGRPEEKRLRALRNLAGELGIDHQLRFMGEVGDIPGLLNTVDLLVHSSTREGCPNALLEAMASGIPLIATDTPGSREALGEASAFLIPESDPEALAQGIVQLLENRDRLEECREEMRRAFRAYSTADRALEDYTDLLASLLA